MEAHFSCMQRSRFHGVPLCKTYHVTLCSADVYRKRIFEGINVFNSHNDPDSVVLLLKHFYKATE